MPTASDKAIAELHKTVKRDPKDTRALLRLAELFAKTGKAPAACDAYTQAGDLFVAQGFARRALSAFVQAFEVARNHGFVERVLPIAQATAKLYAQEKLPREAVSSMDAAIRYLIEKGADADVVTLLEERIALDDTEIARVRLAEAFFRLQQPARASAQLQGVFARLYAQGRRDEALEVAERLLGERCDIPIARAAAEMYLARNRHGDAFLALAKLRVVCSKDPTHLPTLQLLAQAFDQAGHLEKGARVRDEIAMLRGHARKVDLVVVPAPRARAAGLSAEADAGWDGSDPSVAPVASRLDPSRASFWPDETGTSPDASGSVVSISMTDVELLDGAPAESEVRAVTVFETALEGIESLVTQGRLDEALALIGQHLLARPHNALLLERKLEVEDLLGVNEGPPAALYGFPTRHGTTARPRALGR